MFNHHTENNRKIWKNEKIRRPNHHIKLSTFEWTPGDLVQDKNMNIDDIMDKVLDMEYVNKDGNNTYVDGEDSVDMTGLLESYDY